MRIHVTAELFKEGSVIVAHAKALDVASCGNTDLEAIRALKEALELFVEVSRERGTLDRILTESGFVFQEDEWQVPTQAEGWTRDNIVPLEEITLRLACVEV